MKILLGMLSEALVMEDDSTLWLTVKAHLTLIETKKGAKSSLTTTHPNSKLFG